MAYLDNAATTRPYDEVVRAQAEASLTYFANPSSIHSQGSKAKARLDDARANIASMLGAKMNEIYFTSGATESINWAIKGMGLAVILAKTDHKASLESARSMKRSYLLDVGPKGEIHPPDIEKIDEEKALLSLTYVNNETGIVQDIGPLIKMAREKNYNIHLDAVQALGKLDINISELDIDLMSLSAHKIHGPKGVGLLYIRDGIYPKKLIQGGSQENEARAGTENLPGVIGFEKALEISLADKASSQEKVRGLRDYMEEEILERIDQVRINGRGSKRVGSISNISFEGIDSSKLLMMLDMRGFEVSAGSACTAGALEKSHVLQAMHVDEAYIGGSIRVSLSSFNTKEEIDSFVSCLVELVQKLRA